MAAITKESLIPHSRWSWACDVRTPQNGVWTHVYVTRSQGKGPYSCLLTFSHPWLEDSANENLFLGKFEPLDDLVDEVNDILSSLAEAKANEVFRNWALYRIENELDLSAWREAKAKFDADPVTIPAAEIARKYL